MELSTFNNEAKTHVFLPPKPSVREYKASGPASFSVLGQVPVADTGSPARHHTGHLIRQAALS